MPGRQSGFVELALQARTAGPPDVAWEFRMGDGQEPTSPALSIWMVPG